MLTFAFTLRLLTVTYTTHALTHLTHTHTHTFTHPRTRPHTYTTHTHTPSHTHTHTVTHTTPPHCHSTSHFLTTGISMIRQLIANGYYLPVLRVLANITPRFFDHRDTLIEAEE